MPLTVASQSPKEVLLRNTPEIFYVQRKFGLRKVSLKSSVRMLSSIMCLILIPHAPFLDWSFYGTCPLNRGHQFATQPKGGATRLLIVKSP